MDEGAFDTVSKETAFCFRDCLPRGTVLVSDVVLAMIGDDDARWDRGAEHAIALAVGFSSFFLSQTPERWNVY